MLINFEKIIIHNFLSFGHSELVLNTNGYTAIYGENHNKTDNATSNGSGKSSIWEAISWALTGNTIRNCKDIVNIYAGGDGAYVELFFTVDNNQYHIIRSKNHSLYKTNLKIYVNGEDKSGKGIKDSEKLLKDYLPDMTSQLIGSVIILGQGLPQRFSSKTPSERKALLESLSKSDFMIEDIKNRLTSRKDELQAKLRKCQDELLVSNTNMSRLQADLSNEKTLLDSLLTENENNEISGLVERVDSLSKDIATKQNQSNEISEKLNDCRNKYIKIKSQRDNIKLEISTNSSEAKEIVRLDGLSIALTTEKTGVLNEIKVKEQIRDICPTCGQKIPNVVKPDTSGLKHRVDEITEQLNDIKIKSQSLKEQIQRNIDNAIAELSTTMDNLQREGESYKETVNKINMDITSTQRYLDDAKSKLERAKLREETKKEKIDTCQKRITTLTNDISSLQEKMLYISNEQDDTQMRIDTVSKMYNIATHAFRGFLLSNIIEFINQQAKEYCNDVFGSQKIDIVLEDNNINIYFDGKMYENLSGGERQKIDIIVQLSIRDMLCKFSNFSSNILVLDEIFDNLDAYGCQNVLNVISKKLTDVQSVYIITHHADIDLPIDNIINVIKNEDGISEIRI